MNQKESVGEQVPIGAGAGDSENTGKGRKE